MYVKVWDDKYVIKSDTYSYVLAEIKTKASKTEGSDEDTVENEDGTYEVNIAYTKTVAGCYEAIIDREGRKNKCTTLEGYIKHLEKIHKKLEEELEKFAAIVGGTEQLKIAMSKLP